MDWEKINDFLNELSVKKDLTEKTQTTYEAYNNKRYFLNIIDHLKDVGIIDIKDNNGTAHFHLTLAGDLHRILMNNALKR
jgi:predicted transcriptional regulator